jgi:hypothetical protein
MVGGILSGIGEGLVARRERRDQMRNAAYQSGIQALTQISNNPNFSNDPEAVKDITSTAMQMSRVLTGQTDQVPGKGGKMQKQDPWAFVESRLNNAVSQHYGGQPAQERPAPAELPGGIPLPGSDAAAGRTATVPAVKPHRMILTPEEKQQLQIKQQQIEFDEKQRQEEQAAASAKRRKAIDDQTYHERRMAEGKQIGLTGIQLAEYSDPEKRTLTQVQKPPVQKDVVITGPDGKDFYGREDPDTGNLTKITGEPLDPTKYQRRVDKPESDKGELELRQQALRDIESGDPIKVQAGKDYLKGLATKEKGAETRITIAQQNAAQNNAPAAPGTMLTLAEQYIDSGGTITPPLTYRGGDRREFDNAVAQILNERKKSGQDTSLIEQRVNVDTWKSLVKTTAVMKSGKAATDKEIDRAKFLARSIPLTTLKKFNSLMQLVNSEVKDDPDLAAFREALVAARSRYNSMIMSMRSGGGAATNQVRTETLDEVLNRTMQPEAMQRALDEMKVGLQNVMSGYDGVVKEYHDKMTGTGKKENADPLGIL